MKLSRILILDTETDGTHEGARCIEVACALYSVRNAAVIASYASLIHAESNDAFEANHIPVELLRRAPEPERVWSALFEAVGRPEILVSHNAEFDRRFVPESYHLGCRWICTMDDVTWPKQRKPGDNLVSLALSHGVGVVEAHRAMADVDLIARLLTRCAELGHDIGAMLERGLRPKATFAACVPYERREEAKNAGFRWDSDRRLWLRRMAIEDAATLPFTSRQVEVQPCP